MYLLGYDIGSSSVKCSLVEVKSGRCIASAFAPKSEAPIKAVNPGWAEQNPEDWWKYLKAATANVMSQAKINPKDIAAIGISYQMHGLVCVDKKQKVLRPAIIWCDSRAVKIGEEAFHSLGRSQCLTHLLNTPGNFTASKLAWVKRNEPEIFEKIDKIMLPGDYIAMRMTGEIQPQYQVCQKECSGTSRTVTLQDSCLTTTAFHVHSFLKYVPPLTSRAA